MKELGKWGEEQALSFLKQKGYKFLHKNWRSREGEIDLVMQDEETIVFVEVKARTSTRFGFPEESIQEEKLDHLIATAENYLYEQKINLDYRIDCVAIIGRPRGPINISHIKGLQI